MLRLLPHAQQQQQQQHLSSYERNGKHIGSSSNDDDEYDNNYMAENNCNKTTAKGNTITVTTTMAGKDGPHCPVKQHERYGDRAHRSGSGSGGSMMEKIEPIESIRGHPD